MGSYSAFGFVGKVLMFTLRFPFYFFTRKVSKAGEGEIFKFYSSIKEIQFIIRHGVFRVQEIR